MELVKNTDRIALDEVTVLKVQNSQLQIQILQERATNAVLAFLKAQELNEDEWRLDMQSFSLVRAPKPEAVPFKAPEAAE